MRKEKDDPKSPGASEYAQGSIPMPKSEMRNRKREITNSSFALGDTAVARRSSALARISHGDSCIGWANQRKLFCNKQLI
jgi:hypothetical protein